MTIISAMTALTGAEVDQASDLIEVVDASEAGAARNKKITVAELLGLAFSAEAIDDRVSALLTEGSNVTLTYDDVAGTLTIAAATPGTGDIAGFNEAVDDRVAALIDAGAGISIAYNDAAGTLIISNAGAGADALQAPNNLSDVDDPAAARTNLGVYSTAQVDAAVAGAGGAASINAQTGTSYTPVIGDAENVVQLTNAAAITLTIPPNSSVAFPVGTVIELHQGGAGTVTVSPGSGVTLVSRGSVFGLAGQEAVAAIRKVATDTWRLTGDIA